MSPGISRASKSPPSGAQLDETLTVWLELHQQMRALYAQHEGERPWASLDLSMAQLKALMALAHSGGLPAKKLGEKMGVGASAVTPVVDKLEQHMLVRREPDARDRRVVWIRPTPKALALVEKLQQINRSALKRVLDQASPHDLERIHETLQILSRAVAAALARGHDKERA